MRKSLLSFLFFVLSASAVSAQNIHEVEKGETLYALSKKYGIEISSIISNNPHAEYGLKEGMKIVIDESVLRDSEALVGGEKIKYIEHKIRPFETFYSLKNKYELDREDLLKLNPELETSFRAGKVIKIPVIPGKTKLKKKRNRIHESVFYTAKTGHETVVKSTVELTDEELAEKKEADKKEKARLKWFSPETDSYDISFILPFYLTKNDEYLLKDAKSIYPKSEYAVEFYAGAQVAIDQWQRKGMLANINLYDSGNDKNKIGKILSSRDVQASDVIIGPFYTENVKFAADYLKYKSIDIVAPLSSDHSLVRDHENVYQVNPSTRFQLMKTSEYISKRHGNLPVVVIRRDTATEKVLASAFMSSLKDEAHEEMSRTLTVGTKDLIKINRDYFTPDQEYVVIIASEDRVFVSNVLTSLNQLRNENLLTFTTPEIMKFNHIELKYLSNLNVHYPQFGSIDYTSVQTNKFIEAYRAKHGHEPGERFAYIGYDVTNFVMGQLYSEGKLDIKKMDRKQYSKLLIDFVQPEHEGNKFGYINQGISIYKFTEEGKKKMYPFK